MNEIESFFVFGYLGYLGYLLMAVISLALLDVPNEKLKRECIIPLLVWVCFKWSRVLKMLFS